MLPSLCKSPSEIDADSAVYGRTEAFYFAVRIDRTISVAGLAHTINARGDMMNLTDMWKAAKGTASTAPAQWRKLPDTIDFVTHFASNVGKSHITFVTRRGTDGGTFAHWQIGLAYAKYLSPAHQLQGRVPTRHPTVGKIYKQFPVGHWSMDGLGSVHPWPWFPVGHWRRFPFGH